MGMIRILLKVSAICNLCFIAGWVGRFIPLDPWAAQIVKTILILGFVMAFPLNLILCLIISLLLWTGKIRRPDLPRQIFMFNLLLLIFQVLYLGF